MDNIEGTINRVVFRNDDNGYTVVSLYVETMGGWDTTAVGVFPEVHPEIRVRLTGEWTSHPKFGKQFQVQESSIVLPTTGEGIEAYLASGLIRDVGPVSARLIVEVFGADTLRILDEEPERLREVKGIGPTRAANVVESWQKHRKISELMMFLQSYGITTGLAIKIYETYGADAVQVVQQNPYRLTEIAGVGFKKADQVAQAMGFDHDAPERVRAGVLYTLQEQSARAGHVFVPQPELVAKAAALLGVASALVESEIGFLERNEKKVTVDDGDVYLKLYYEAETSVAGHIRLLTATDSPIRDEVTNNVLAKAVQGLSITLSSEQREAVRTALTNKVTVLTGGPGTGKTTVTQAIIQALDAIECQYALCAPTGRAAKRLTEATGREALTIHRLLEYNPREEERFGHDELNPLPVGFLIIDECSMLDLQLADHLLRAVDLPAHVLFVGDVDQLPSVGAGNVLRDIIESERVAVVRLHSIFRQAADSGIITNAHRINQGKFPICNDGFGDFFLFVQKDPQEAVEWVVDVVSHRIPAKFGFRSGDIQVLAPMYKGDCGIDALNARLQEALNPAAPRKAERKLASKVFREGDRVMQIRNCYDKDVFNGDVGILKAIDAEKKEMLVIVDGRRVTYDWNEVDELVHAYAISIHKAQGQRVSCGGRSGVDAASHHVEAQPALHCYHTSRTIGGAGRDEAGHRDRRAQRCSAPATLPAGRASLQMSERRGGVGDRPHSTSIHKFSQFPLPTRSRLIRRAPRRFDSCKPDLLLFYLAFARVEQSTTPGSLPRVEQRSTVTTEQRRQPMDSIIITLLIVFALPTAVIVALAALDEILKRGGPTDDSSTE